MPLPGHELRPTSERAREAYFDIVSSQIGGADFLDLFSGSGIFSFEAISRGARSAVAIDQSKRSMTRVESISREWELPIHTIAADAVQGLRRIPPELTFDLVFADPPYSYPRYQELLGAVDTRIALSSGATAVIEHGSDRVPFDPSGLQRLTLRKTVRYGSVAMTILDRIDRPDDELPE
ncbi:MAG: RsmD family RNA methyltransferase [Thermoanaerobaculia bacterium]